MEIYLVRHTTPDIEKGICYGQLNVDLIENYEKEFETLKLKLPNYSEPTIYSSPLVRCIILANFIPTNSKVIIHNSLMEMNFGDWEGKAWSDIDKEELNSWMIDFVNNPAKNGENFLKMFNRVKLFIDELILENQHTNKPIFIFTHAGVIRCFVAYLLEIPLNNAFKIPIDIASVTSIRLNADKNYNKINYLNS